MSGAFLLTALVVCVAPGIGVVYTLSMAIRGGVRAGLLASLGCTLCTLLHLGFALAGLAAVLHTTAVVFQTVKLAGAAYLLWTAWSTLRGGGLLELRPADEVGSARRIVWRGIALNLLNPKLPLFFVAFLPQVVPAAARDTTALLAELGIVFVAMTFAVFVVYALFAATLRHAIVESPAAQRLLRGAVAASFAALGARLALERA